MGKCFSDAVEKALQYIYYDVRSGRGEEGLKLLEEAANNGDGDAYCIWARCMNGPGYVWSGHHFQENARKARKLLHKSVELGSAIGVLVALRSGELTPSLEEKMQFANLQEAFEQVLSKAEAGDAFCQYTIGNVYFWWDFLRIQGKGKDSFPNREAFRTYLKENIAKCEGWFQKAIRGGMYSAVDNLTKYYEEGDEDLILPQPEKAKGLYRISAEQGYPIHQHFYADELADMGRQEEALQWHKKAVEGGEADSWFHIGRAYDLGEVVTKDPAYAAQCYEKCAEQPGDSNHKVNSINLLGEKYFKGNGVPQDYARSYQLLRYGYERNNKYGLYYMGKCCFAGLGVRQDYVQARKYLEEVYWENKETWYMLGCIYGRGLGVEADIPKAVDYLHRAGDRKDAKEELLHYKKTLFGKWVRR